MDTAKLYGSLQNPKYYAQFTMYIFLQIGCICFSKYLIITMTMAAHNVKVWQDTRFKTKDKASGKSKNTTQLRIDKCKWQYKILKGNKLIGFLFILSISSFIFKFLISMITNYETQTNRWYNIEHVTNGRIIVYLSSLYFVQYRVSNIEYRVWSPNSSASAINNQHIRVKCIAMQKIKNWNLTGILYFIFSYNYFFISNLQSSA